MKKIIYKFFFIIVLIISGCTNTSNNSGYSTNTKAYYEANRMSYFKNYGYPTPAVKIKKPVPYLQANSHLKTKRFLSSYNEKEILKFYKRLGIEGIGDNSYYWRWHFKINEKNYSRSINRTLYSTYRASSSSILTLQGKKWIKKPISQNSLGTLQNIIVMERGKSGVITYLLIKGSEGDFLVKGEYAVRKVMGLNPNNTGKKINIELAKGGDKNYSRKAFVKSPTLLLSGYFAVEKVGSNYHVYGGGFGHGVGMSQYGAYDLGENYRYSYKKILNKYYQNITLKNMYRLSGVSKNIRVGLTTTGFGSLDHNVVTMYSTSKAEIWNGWMRIKLAPRDKVKIIPSGGKQILYVNGKKRVETVGKLNFKSSKNQFVITSIKRQHTRIKYPVYRGKIEVALSKTNSRKLRIINEVFIEDYLLQVVPSEMMRHFGVEALKAQAVAARTYALNDYLKSKNNKEAFNVRDDTHSQVYNRIDENPETTKAVKSTYGQVMLYNGRPIDAKYYSSSGGYGGASQNVW